MEDEMVVASSKRLLMINVHRLVKQKTDLRLNKLPPQFPSHHGMLVHMKSALK
jgi:hypothetical protein